MVRQFYCTRLNIKRLCYIVGGTLIIQMLIASLVIHSKRFILNTDEISVTHRGAETSSTVERYVNNQSTPLKVQNILRDPKKAKRKDQVIDMVNDYYPKIDFKFEFPEIIPVIKDNRDIFLVVLVNSAAKSNKNRRRRANIRKTWGNMKSCEHLRATNNTKIRNLKWILVFVIGKEGPGTNDDELNIEEAKQHNDILIGNIKDDYFNNIVKFYMGQLWASTLNAKYTLKTDDDVYVRIPSVVEFLADRQFPRRFYGGAIQHPHSRRVHREHKSKWGISKKYYAEDVWPPYHYGAFIILSTDLLSSLFNYVHISKPFHIDDAYIGVSMRHFKVNATNISSFVLKGKMAALLPEKSSCDILALTAIGHKLDGTASTNLHQRFELLCKNSMARLC